MPNLATTRAIIWRRFAAVRRRFMRPERPAPVPPGPPPAAPPPADEAGRPAPLLVDYFGRDGSTALLRMLSTSPSIHVEGRYPYEQQRLRPILSGADPAAAWRAFCAHRLDAGARRRRWYAEKLLDVRDLDLTALPEARTVVLLRDPRDTYVSIEAFSRAVGQGDIGGTGTPGERFERFIERQRERLAWIAGLEGARTLLVSYESLVFDAAGVARDLSDWLAVEIDAAGLAGDFRLRWVHGTAADPRRSVGRWRQELDEAKLRELEARLADRMAAVGIADWDRA